MDVNWVRATIGTIITNLQSLEFALRLFLAESVGPGQPKLNIHHLQLGDSVSESYLTDYDSLGTVIRKANRHLKELHRPERVDADLVRLRDALAHGRVFALNPDGPYMIRKFGKPVDGRVEVVYALDLTEDRLRLEVKRSGEEIHKVIGVARDLGVRCFPKD
jgi:hypothetical protein